MSKEIELVKFVVAYKVYNVGEVAGYSPADARSLYARRIAVPVAQSKEAPPVLDESKTVAEMFEASEEQPKKKSKRGA